MFEAPAVKTGDVDEADRLRAEIGMSYSLTEELSYLNEQCAKDAENEREERETRGSNP